MNAIKSVVAITPVWNEPLGMIQKFRDDIADVQRTLASQTVGMRHFFLNDAALYLPDDYPMLVRHAENMGLTQTLLDGYRSVLELKQQPDLVVRLDCNEHDPLRILDAVDHVSHANVDALFLPVWYWVAGSPRPPMKDITGMIADFTRALSPVDIETVLAIYNQKFPIGYQIFRPALLERLLPRLLAGIALSEKITGERARWGLDLLAILLAANENPDAVDFLFGGWATPWAANRGPEKIVAQREKAAVVVRVVQELGCPVAARDLRAAP